MSLAKPFRRSLIIAPATVTEAVLAQPLLAVLQRFDAFGRIDVLADTAMAPVFRAMTEVDEVIESNIGMQRIALFQRLALAGTIEARNYDCAYILQDNLAAAITPWLARIPRRIGARSVPGGAPGSRRAASSRVGGGAAFALPNRYGAGAGRLDRSHVQRFLAMAFAPEESQPSGIPPPRLGEPPPMSDALARHLDLDTARQLVLLCPASELGPTSEWPARHYAELAALIALQWPEVVIGLLGRPGDRALATQVKLLSGEDLRNWCGRTDLAQTLALVNHAAAVVTSESQYMHLAAALGRPHVALYGAGDPRAERVNDTRRSVMWLRLECSPCLDAHCRYGHMNCVNLQMPAQVFASLRKAMRFSATA